MESLVFMDTGRALVTKVHRALKTANRRLNTLQENESHTGVLGKQENGYREKEKKTRERKKEEKKKQEIKKERRKRGRKQDGKG